MPSFLFCLDDVFEDFVRNVCREGVRSFGIGIANGNIPRNHGSLFLDTRRFPTKPDLLCRRGNSVIAIGEVKYKPRLDEADRYQVISHVTSTRAPLGFWVSPASTADEAGLAYVGRLPTDARFYHYRIYLGHDIRGQCEGMVEAIAGLLKPL